MSKPTVRHLAFFATAILLGSGELAVAATTLSETLATIQAEEYISESGTQTDLTNDSDPGTYVGWINNHDYTTYNIYVQQGGTYSVNARVSSPNDGGTIAFRTSSGVVGTLDVNNTNGWQRWENVSTTIQLAAGEQQLTLAYIGDSGYLFNIDWFDMKLSDTVTGTPPMNPPAGNCSDNIQDCIDTAADNGGGEVVLDAKTYELTDTLTLRSNVELVGQGTQTLITWEPSIAGTINEPLIHRGRGGDGISNVVIKNMSILCTVDNTDLDDRDRTDHMAIFIDGGGDPADAHSLQHQNIVLENLEVRNCGGTGIHIKGTNNLTADGLFMSGNGWFTEDLLHNIYYLRVRNAEIRNSTFVNSPAGHGMRMGSIENAHFENLVVEGNSDHGIHMNSVENITGSGLTVRNNCVTPMGACREIACYGDCDYDFE